MPLTELMNYFNDQLQAQVRTKSLPKTGFYKAENTYWARFGSLILGSQFHAITHIADDTLIGYDSELLVRSSTGNSLDIDSIFNSLDNTDQIIHLDRLVRTLHSLNYLQEYDGKSDLLSLHVQPRHIVSVIEDHGKTFENILSDCGLVADKVLLHTRLLDEPTLKHFYNALSSYKSRGYKIGINITQPKEIDLLIKLGLEPDVVFYQYPALKDVVKPKALYAGLHREETQSVSSQRILVTGDAAENQYNRSLLNIFDGILIKSPAVIDDVEIFRKYHGPANNSSHYINP